MNDLGVDEKSVEIAFIEPNVGAQTLSGNELPRSKLRGIEARFLPFK